MFPIGIFSDGNLSGADPATFRAMLDDIRAHNLDSVMLTNGSSARANILSESDALGMPVYFAPTWELDRQWWPDSVPANIDTARSVIYPIADALKAHPSLRGYYTYDYPPASAQAKLALAQQAFAERDTTNPAWPVFGGDQDLDPVIAANINPAVIVTSCYVITGQPEDPRIIPLTLRYCWGNRKPGTPLWVILQTHTAGWLITPTAEQVRYMHWQTVAEGATGIFWFTYETQQGWTGLRDNPALFGEVADLAARTAPFTGLLETLKPVVDSFTIDGGGSIRTLAGPSGTYIIAVNCGQLDSNASLTISGPKGRLDDLEAKRNYRTGQPIRFRPGDGRIFRYQHR